MNILITGATGFVGRNFSKYAVENFGGKIYAIIRENSDASLLDKLGITTILYDGRVDSLNDFFSKTKIDVIVHLATLYIFDHKPSEVAELIDSNIKFGCNLLEAASNNNCHNFINAGSYIQNYFSEEFYPSCLYAVTKQSFQNVIDYYSLNRGVKAITLKLYDVYGPNDERKKILNLFREGKKMKMSPGEQEMRLTYIDDILNAFKIAIESLFSYSNTEGHKVYYVGSKAYKLKEVAKIFERVSKIPLDIEWGAFPYRNNQPINSYIGDTLPGWKPEIDLESGIKSFLQK